MKAQKSAQLVWAQPGRVQFAGIVRAAQQLHVSRVHLWQVLTGRRESRRLLARYRALRRAT